MSFARVEGKSAFSQSRTDVDSYLSRYSIQTSSSLRTNLNCQQWIEQFPEYYYKKCTQDFETAQVNLARSRIRAIHKKGDYAKHLTKDTKSHEEFFSKLTLLIERKEDDSERAAILSFLAELCAIEYEGFGEAALGSLQELTECLQNVNAILPSVVGHVFMDKNYIWSRELKGKNGGVLMNMNTEYFLRISSILVKLFGHRTVGKHVVKEIASVHEPDNQTPIFAQKLIECFQLSKKHLIAKAPQNSRVNSKDLRRREYENICALISVCVQDHADQQSQNGRMADAVWKQLKTGDDFIRMLVLKREGELPTDRYYQRAAELNMCARIILNQRNPNNRNKFKAADKVTEEGGVFDGLLEKFRTQTADDPSGVPDHAEQQYLASLIRCINSVLYRSNRCYEKLKLVGLNMNISRFVQRFFKLAQTGGQHGAVVLAALTTIWIFIQVPRLWEFRDILEDGLPQRLQAIMKNLMQKKRTSITEDDSQALEKCIEIMQYYNEIYMQGIQHKSFQYALKTDTKTIKSRKINALATRAKSSNSVAAKLNLGDVKGYDREQVLFRIIENSGNSNLFTSQVLLGAAKCLATVPLEQFDQQEIRRVVTALSQIGVSGMDNAFRVVTRILFLLARLAMAGAEEEQKVLVKKVADGFRRLYASEVVATTLDLCIRASTEVTGPNDVKYLNQHKRNFMRACVKFLMTAWSYPDLREGMISEAAKTSLSRVLLVEQKLVQHATPEQLLSWKPVFLEQTFAGSDVGNLLHCILSLGKTGSRDIVAFRVFHQLANILQGANMHDGPVGDYKEKLTDALMVAAKEGEGSFDTWDKCRSGTDIEILKAVEKEELHDEENEKDRQTCMPEELADCDHKSQKTYKIYTSIFNLIMKASSGLLSGAAITDLKNEKRKFIDNIKSWRNDEKFVFLVRTMDEPGKAGKISEAMICGGEVRESTKMILGSTAIPEFAGELYYMFVHPNRSNDIKFINEILSEFSHQMYLRKFAHVIALAHEEESGMFSSELIQKGDHMHPKFHRKKLKEILLEHKGKIQYKRENYYLPKQDEVVRNYLRMWDLGINIWQENTAHKNFLKLKGIETLVQFATNSQTDQAPMSRTKDLLMSQQFGTELMLLLDEKNVDFKMPPKPDASTFNTLLRQTFVNPLLGGDFERNAEYSDALKMILTDRNDTGTPAWNKFLVGSHEENFLSVETMTPFPEPFAVKHQSIFRPNPHASEDFLFHRGPRKHYQPRDAFDAMEASVISSDKIKKVHRMSDYRTETNPQCEARSDEAKKKEEHDNIVLDKKKEQEPHHHAITAAMIRTFYVLITKSSTMVRERTQAKLRLSKIIYPIITTMKSFDYGIDRSVYKREKHNYGAAMKFLVLIQKLTDINARGHEACLQAIEFYEILGEMVLDIMDKMRRLISSRDFDKNNFKPGTPRRLTWFDEKMLSESTATIVELVREISSLNFFEGKTKAIWRGNTHCRKAALQNMFTKNQKLVDILISFLQYDTEINVSGESNDDGGGDENYFYNHDEVFRREFVDQMRVNIITILAELLNFDETFKYRFFRQYSEGVVKAIVGLRQSFVEDVMRNAGWSKLRIQLQGKLINRGFFKGSGKEAEVIEEICPIFLRGAPRVLLLSNQRYFLSTSTLPEHLLNLSSQKVDTFTTDDWYYFAHLEELKYEDIRGIYRAYGDQKFAIATIDSIVRVFQNMELGIVSRLVNVFARYCRDDLDEPLLNRAPQQFKYDDLKSMKEKRKDFFETARNALISRLSEIPSGVGDSDVVCHTSALFGPLGSSLSPKVLLWISTSSDHFLIVCNTTSSWEPTSFRNNPDEYYRSALVLPMKHMTNFEFIDASEPQIVMEYKEEGKYPSKFMVQFACDAARELWRREVRKYIITISVPSKWAPGIPPKVVDNASEVKAHRFV